MEPLHYKTHIYAGMFYIEAGVLCIEVGHEVGSTMQKNRPSRINLPISLTY